MVRRVSVEQFRECLDPSVRFAESPICFRAHPGKALLRSAESPIRFRAHPGKALVGFAEPPICFLVHAGKALLVPPCRLLVAACRLFVAPDRTEKGERDSASA